MFMQLRDRSTLKSTQSDDYVYPNDKYECNIGFSEDYSDPDYAQCIIQVKAKEFMKNFPDLGYDIQSYNEDGYSIEAKKIKMTGNRVSDNREYKRQNGITLNIPYEIHHNADMNKYDDTCTMIALPKIYHDSIKPHWGAVCQYHSKYGCGY